MRRVLYTVILCVCPCQEKIYATCNSGTEGILPRPQLILGLGPRPPRPQPLGFCPLGLSSSPQPPRPQLSPTSAPRPQLQCFRLVNYTRFFFTSTLWRYFVSYYSLLGYSRYTGCSLHVGNTPASTAMKHSPRHFVPLAPSQSSKRPQMHTACRMVCESRGFVGQTCR